MEGTVWNWMLDEPVPVAMPEARTRLPPFRFVPPLAAPPACTVRLLPAVEAVYSRSIQMISGDWPERDNRFVADEVPMPIFAPDTYKADVPPIVLGPE